jgi:hypothetical protein
MRIRNPNTVPYGTPYKTVLWIWIRMDLRICMDGSAFILIGWIRIHIDKKCWIRILTESNANQQHCYKYIILCTGGVYYRMHFTWRC